MLQERLPPHSKPSISGTVERFLSVILGGKAEGSRIRNYHLLYEDHSVVARSFKLDEVLDAFEARCRLGVAELSNSRIFVHAGVVGWKDRAILLPGRSFVGKTSLVAELVKLGATYYSDEFAVLDPNGCVHAFPKPLSVRQPGETKQVDVPVEHLGGRVGTKPLAPGLVVASSYKAGARWKPRLLTPAHGALTLLANTVPARRDPERVLATLERVVTAAPTFKGGRGEAEQTAHLILERLERQRRRGERWVGADQDQRAPAAA